MIRKLPWPKIELLFFTFITLANLIPFVSTKFFPSLDGASHLSNANIINQLLVFQNDLFRQFFQINPEPVPNWTSHLLLSWFGLILPAFLAEKIIVISLLLGLPFAFRSLMKSLDPENISLSYLVFPFTHSMFLFFGFFNFCIGIVFFMITLRYWLVRHGIIKGLKEMFILFFFILITYFSHILVFGVLLIVIAVHIIADTLPGLFRNTMERKKLFRDFFRKTGIITMVSAIPLFLFVYFFMSRPGIREISFLTKSQLLEFLYRIRPLISFNPEKEGIFTIIFFGLLVFLILTGILIIAYRFFSLKNRKVNPNSEWLIPSIFILVVLYFFLPDAYGTASYTNLRLGFILFLLTILWISTFPLPRWMGIMAAATAIAVNVMMIEFNKPLIREFGKMAEDCNKASQHIAPNSLVLPIYLMDNWFTGHFVDYMAVDKPILMVYNYECETGYFPVIWNTSTKPNYFIGNPSDSSHYINFALSGERKSLKINYIFVMGKIDPGKDWFFSMLDKILVKTYVPVYSTEFCCLYQSLTIY